MPTPDLSTYYGSLVTNETERIQAKIVGYDTIGSGEFSVLKPSQIKFSGQYSAFGHQGNVDLSLSVIATNEGSFTLNGHGGECTFQELDGGYLQINFAEGGGPTSLQVEWWDNGLWIGGPATRYDLWIGP